MKRNVAMTLEERNSINELREMVRAAVAYCQVDSRSDRRRKAMIQGGMVALVNAQDAFGDEQ